MFFVSQHFGGRRACQSSGIRIKKIDKQVNYSHEPAKTKQQVGQCIVGALLVHGQATGKHRLTKFTTARTWGKPPPSPLQYTLCLATGPAPKYHFVPRLPSGSLEILKIGILTILETHNLVFRPLIEMKFKAKLQPLSKAFQRYVACHLHTRKSGQFPTFNGQKSNWQFDFWPFFWP